MEKKKLGKIATYVNGYAFKPTDWRENGLPIIRIQDLTGSSYQLNYYDGDYLEKIELNNGDVLISWSASLGVYIWNRGKALLNQHIFKVVFDKEEIVKEYFFYAVKFNLATMLLHMHGATMKHIVKKDFDNIEIPYPSIEKQREVAQVLSKVEALISKRKQQLDYFDNIIKSRFVEMFGDPVSNSKGLIEYRLSEIGEFGRGVSKHRPRNAPELLGGKYPLIQTGDVANTGLYITKYESTYSEVGYKQSKMWDKGTLCITIAANIAKTAILSFDACFPDSVVGFCANEKTNNIYIHFWFSFFQSILEAQAPESAQKNINLKVLSELKVIIPPIDEQNVFLDFVQLTDKLKVEVQKSLDESQMLFDSLMQKYFS